MACYLKAVDLGV
jgi:hypothetical protein